MPVHRCCVNYCNVCNPRATCVLAVDASQAGRGQLEISVNGGRVPNNVEMRGPGRCMVTFLPHEPGTYIIDVTFNGDLVKGGPFLR